ncbi:hypothetical protein CMK14_03300 [Candidatus Poribacteria bacterium]|nr:hypothetical protein [Candidatus Poribacteria bacterium]
MQLDRSKPPVHDSLAQLPRRQYRTFNNLWSESKAQVQLRSGILIINDSLWKGLMPTKPNWGLSKHLPSGSNNNLITFR